ncbi:MAG: preprotein translocase subunit SecE [Candidatus Buchananbacteria bacterium CG10_big_fil_rev_8_21_14_0_10_42_9]|uniref:Protein translocase subunit SecE n=1 Tax=Candidatus Buchananbacteria bacterium CG10_big_fil_rev_8_21_14_0_10_42_9 TaxID=1974526 RepID=A0A2H0W2P9_9BACT|nr:MAG: preprotein translocase subunit SecE [Candidatus Buchananbacteria bacterium CG10_big_fil_rev_8_21_14_0_10_42_9]
MKKLFKYLREAREELAKVAWPTRQKTIQHTILVVVISLAVATFLGLVDYILNLGLERII